MKYSPIILLMLIFNSCISVKTDSCSINSGKTSGLKTIVLQNGILKTEIIPEATGRISSIYYKPGQVELLSPYWQKTTFVDVLVPPRSSSNRGGYKEWFWGEKNGNITKMKPEVILNSQNKVSISLFDEYYQNQSFSLTRTVTLDKNSTDIQIGVKIKNVGDTKQKLALWLNLIPTINESSKLIIPAAGNKKLVMGKRVYSCKFDQLLELKETALNSFFVSPARPWFAIAMTNKKVILAYQVKDQYLKPQGLLYTWKGYVKGKKRKTLEMILSPQDLHPGKSAEFQFKIIVFSGLTSLNAISKNIGIQAKHDKKNNSMKLTFSSCRKEAPQTLTINFGDTNHPVIYNIPKLSPGIPFSITIPLPNYFHKQKNVIVSGKFSSGGTFKLLPELDTKS
jgi:hypothetical protein